jgi:hypothetical protein
MKITKSQLRKIIKEELLKEASTEERVAATAKRAKAFDAKMRKKHYGSEDAEEAPKDPKKAYADKEQRSVKGAGDDVRKYFALMAPVIAGHLSGKKPTGYPPPKNAKELLQQLSKLYNTLAKDLTKEQMITLMKNTGLPTSLK